MPSRYFSTTHKAIHFKTTLYIQWLTKVKKEIKQTCLNWYYTFVKVSSPLCDDQSTGSFGPELNIWNSS